MANTSLPSLTERTATANSDLIHVNSGGTDYKETKANFLSDVNSSIYALNNSLTPSSTIDAFSIANSNITQLERAYIRKYGKVCVVDLTFTVGTAITDSTAVLFTGLPNGIGNQRFRIPHGYDASKADLVLALTTDGKIINQWSSGGIGTGQWQGQFTYIMA